MMSDVIFFFIKESFGSTRRIEAIDKDRSKGEFSGSADFPWSSEETHQVKDENWWMSSPLPRKASSILGVPFKIRIQ